MKMWIIVGIIVGVLALAGFAIANSIIVSADTPTQKTATCGSSSCSGTCTAESGCGSATCGATKGGTCGCGKK